MTAQTQAAGVDSYRPLDGRVAVVTGAAKGLGGAITDLLARQGAQVVLAGRDLGALREHSEAIDQRYPYRDSLVVQCDVTDPEAVENLMTSTLDRFKGIDILVNAHGVIGPIETPAQNVTVEQFRDVLEVNVVSVFLVIKAAIPYLIERGGGRIVNIAGTSGLRGYRHRVSYSSSKWAVRGMTRTLALELGPHDITVNTVCPNVTNGERMDKIVREKARNSGKLRSKCIRTLLIKQRWDALLTNPMWLRRWHTWCPMARAT